MTTLDTIEQQQDTDAFEAVRVAADESIADELVYEEEES